MVSPELVTCGVLLGDAEDRVTYANGTLAGWLGVAPEELLGQRVQELLTPASRIFYYAEGLPALAREGRVSELVLALKHRDGSEVALRVSLARRAEHSLEVTLFPARLHARGDDDSAQRAAEADAVRERERAFRTLAENLPDIVTRFDRERRIVYTNPAVERLLGHPSASYAGLRIGERAAGPDTAQRWSEALDRALSGAEVTIRYDYPSHAGLRTLESKLVPERNGRGEVVSALSITRDVTLLVQAEQSAARSAALAEQLVGMVSHDLRTPVQAIVLGAQLLAEDVAAPSAPVVVRVARAAQRASRLIDTLLDFTQARLGGGLRVRRERIDLHRLAVHSLDELRPAHPARVLVHERAGLGAVEGDPDRLAQVLSNLLHNALTYGAPDTPITLSTEVHGAGFSIAVHNFGSAIPDELREALFEPMRRGPSHPHRRERSVGLGLYIVREIARAHGGTVSVSSSVEAGTRFRFVVGAPP